MLYRAQEDLVNFDSARQSQIEAQRSDRESHSKTMAAETREGPVDLRSAEQVNEVNREDRFDKVAASQNSPNLTERGIYRPTELQAFLREQGIQAKKGLSQNFLIDGNIVQKILDTAEISEGDLVLEIGPGPGALTQALLKREAIVSAVEMDTNFARELNRLQTEDNRLEVYCDDILEFPLLEFLQRQPKKIKVVANLPYHVTTPILTRFLPLYQHVESLTIMVQKEFADRMRAVKNTPEYSSFTLFLQFYAAVLKNFTISPNCFYPKPKVHSSVVHCKLHTPLLEEDKTEAFFQMTRTAFGKRRKMLRSSLKDLYTTDMVEQALPGIGHPPTARPEELGIEEFIAFLNALNSKTIPIRPSPPLSPLPGRPDSRCRI